MQRTWCFITANINFLWKIYLDIFVLCPKVNLSFDLRTKILVFLRQNNINFYCDLALKRLLVVC